MEKQLFWICVLQASLLVFCQDTDKTESVQNSESTSTEDTKSQVFGPIYTKSGPVKGKRIDKDGSTHSEFLGIPYAEPPIGKLRFKSPKPVQKWNETLEAYTDGPMCIQTESFETGGSSDMAEDCLTLNIFTKSIDLDEPKAVMIWIYGGGFTSGSKNIYRMQGIIDENVILVAMNYRLHALGFLSFGSDLVSGNMGLKDQQLAIQWVKNNIEHFGGDPEKITIFGESAGGVSVQAHVLSPYNKDMLSGAIAQSGSVLYLNIQPQGSELKTARNVAETLGCPATLEQSTLDCLQEVDIRSVLGNITDPEEAQVDPSIELKYFFGPVIDSYSRNPFLPNDPLESLKTGMFHRIPYMSGTVTNEGAPIGIPGREGAATLRLIESPAQAGFQTHYGQDKLFGKLSTLIYNHTTGESTFEQERPAINFFTDSMFLSSDQKSVGLMSVHVRDVYNYHFSQQTNNSLIGQFFELPIEYTPMHGDDVAFLVSSADVVDLTNFSDEEKSASRNMIKYWTNFAKHGSPSPALDDDDSPTWFPVTPTEKVSSF